MLRFVLGAALLVLSAACVNAAGLTGQYIEARTCDVWTGPCFANAEMNLTGKHAVLGWKVDKGSLGAVRLDGLGVVAVVAAHDTLGLTQTGPARAVLIVDRRADDAQREGGVGLRAPAVPAGAHLVQAGRDGGNPFLRGDAFDDPSQSGERRGAAPPGRPAVARGG